MLLCLALTFNHFMLGDFLFQETFGAMAKTEKIAFILEQVRLCLDKKDFIRAQILSRKVSPKAFVERKGEAKGDIGIEGTAIEAPDEVRGPHAHEDVPLGDVAVLGLGPLPGHARA